jgi:predicted CoA-substrate-specific enzyme activase
MRDKKTKAYLGFDIGSISTKAVVIDKENNILAQTYLWTKGNPIDATKRVLKEIESQLKGKNISIVGVGTTGSARELIGVMLNANLVKNEITAHAIGTLEFHPDVKTIFEIGGQDSKIIILNQGIVVDYAMNTLCAAGTGSFLSAQARRLDIPVEEFGNYAIKSQNPTKIAGRCTVFAESDLVHKAQMGFPKEDIIAGLCNAIVNNYLNNVGKGKNIETPIVFQGGVSKNVGVVQSFENIIGSKILVDELGHLMGAIGVAILAREQGKEKEFNFNIQDIEFKTISIECGGCANNCEVICVLRNGKLIDSWGNRCEAGKERAKSKLEEKDNIFHTNIKSVNIIAKNTIEVILEKPENFSFQAGQYIFITLPQIKHLGVKESTRAMTIASSPNENKLSLIMRISNSLFKREIESLMVGDKVEIQGAFGKDILIDNSEKPVVFFAGGVGITPFLSIIQQEQEKNWSKKITLFYTNKNKEETIFFKELQKIKNDNFKFIPTMTRLSEKEKENWQGETGRIDIDMIKKYIKNPDNILYYIVGLPQMVHSISNILTNELKIKKENIRIELFAVEEK